MQPLVALAGPLDRAKAPALRTLPCPNVLLTTTFSIVFDPPLSLSLSGLPRTKLSATLSSRGDRSECFDDARSEESLPSNWCHRSPPWSRAAKPSPFLEAGLSGPEKVATSCERKSNRRNLLSLYISPAYLGVPGASWKIVQAHRYLRRRSQGRTRPDEAFGTATTTATTEAGGRENEVRRDLVPERGPRPPREPRGDGEEGESHQSTADGCRGDGLPVRVGSAEREAERDSREHGTRGLRVPSEAEDSDRPRELEREQGDPESRGSSNAGRGCGGNASHASGRQGWRREDDPRGELRGERGVDDAAAYPHRLDRSSPLAQRRSWAGRQRRETGSRRELHVSPALGDGDRPAKGQGRDKRGGAEGKGQEGRLEPLGIDHGAAQARWR